MSARKVGTVRQRPLSHISDTVMARADDDGVLLIKSATPGGVSINVRLTYAQWAAVQALVDNRR